MSKTSAISAASTPAIYLGIVQFVFLTTWTVYAIFLPGLLESVGIAKRWTAWVLMGDQILFVVFDVAAGYFADRVHRLYGRIGPWIVGATAISCLAFLLHRGWRRRVIHLGARRCSSSSSAYGR